MRERITAQFNDLYTRAQAIQAEIDALAAAQAPAPDASLLDELPYAAANLTDAPEHVKARLYDALDIQALYRQHIRQVTIWATITVHPRHHRCPAHRPPHRQRHICLRPAAMATTTIQDH
jgi:hypothetical protein